MTTPFNVTFKATNQNPVSGEWIGLTGEVLGPERHLSHAEVWLKINKVYVKCIPQATWEERFWFSARFGPGRYVIEAEGYKIRMEGLPSEWKISSPKIVLTVLPRIGGLRFRTFQIENFRRVKLEEGLSMARRLKPFIVRRYPDTENVFLVGGLAYRGWTKRDVDILCDSSTLASENLDFPLLNGHRVLNIKTECERIIGYPVTVMVNTHPIDKDKSKKIRL